MISNTSILLPFLGLIASCVAEHKVLKEKKDNPFDKKFAKLAKSTLDLWNVPGVAIAVIDGDDVFAKGYGIATYPDTPVTPSTLFYTGSTTKAFTAAAVSLLIDNSSQYSNIQWNTPIVNLIRGDFALENEYATAHTTIEDALSHRSGMPRHDFSYGGHYNGHPAVPRDIVRSLRFLPLSAEPRTKYQYCNMMFITVSHVIEILTGVWLGEFLKERIWEPLGMKSTYFSTSDAKKGPEHLAQGYVYHNQVYQPVRYMDLTSSSGAGAIVSNVLDYAKWIHAHIHTSGPISEAGYQALKTARAITPNTEQEPFTGISAYTLGWDTMVYKGYQMFQHSGGMEAFGADVLYIPELKYGVVALGNTAVTSNNAEKTLVWKLLDDKLGIKENERFNWNEFGQKSLEAAKQQYENAVQEFYPKKPVPALPPSLPLQNYTGTYFHPAYRNMTIFLKDNMLHINRQDVSWPIFLDIKHVSGDNFMAYVDSTTAPGLVFKHAAACEFRIGSDGVPDSFGIAAEPEMGKDGRIRFNRG